MVVQGCNSEVEVEEEIVVASKQVRLGLTWKEEAKFELFLEEFYSRVIGLIICCLNFYKNRKVIVGFPLKKIVLALDDNLYPLSSCLIVLYGLVDFLC